MIERKMINRPSGLVVSSTVGLWGLGRFFEEHLWLAYPGHLGAILVQIAGLGLFVVGVAWSVWLLTHRDSHVLAEQELAYIHKLRVPDKLDTSVEAGSPTETDSLMEGNSQAEADSLVETSSLTETDPSMENSSGL